MTITEVPGVRKQTMQQMAPSPPRPLTTPLRESRYRSEAASLSTPACSRGRAEWNNDDSPVVKSEDDSEDNDDDDHMPGDVHVESASQSSRISHSAAIHAFEENAVCRQCMEQTPPLITSIVCEEVTSGMATEIFCRCNAKKEHGDNMETHSWEISGDRRQEPPGKTKLSMALSTINNWLMAMTGQVGN